MVEISVTCEPTSFGMKTGQLNVQTNDVDEPMKSWSLACEAVDDSDGIHDDGFEDL